MINHPLTILQRIPAFAKLGLIHPNPLVQVLEGACQVQGSQPVPIPYQIREVSVSRTSPAPPSLNLWCFPGTRIPERQALNGRRESAAEPLPAMNTRTEPRLLGATSVLQEGLVFPNNRGSPRSSPAGTLANRSRRIPEAARPLTGATLNDTCRQQRPD